MSLRNILIDCAAETGLNLNNPADKTWLKVKINEAAEDLYTSDDLVGCLREQLFSIAVDDEQITLPWYVYKIRGVRWKTLKYPVRLDDMRPRYATQGYNEMSWRGMTWRIKDGRSPIGKDITNAAPLVISIPVAETVTFKVNVTGSTNNSVRITETVTFAPGDLTKTLINTFINTYGVSSIESITKDILTTNDVIVTDTNGTEISRIPNSELSASYTIIQIVDFDQTTFVGESNPCIEILFKLKFTPFNNDYDEFPCPGYDKAIFYKFMELYKGKAGEFDNARAAKYKCNEIIGNLSRETEDSENIPIDFGRNGFLEAQKIGITDVRYRRRYPHTGVNSW